MKIISWNVLHIAYEKEYNPNSLILKKYNNDNDRLMDIIKYIKTIIDSQTIICM